MQYLVIVLLLINIFFTGCYSATKVKQGNTQETPFDPDVLLPARIGDKRGYINSRGQVVIQPQFDEAHMFSDGLAMVIRQGRRAFIDKRGNEAFQIKLEDAISFSEGLAGFRTDTSWGFIDKKGKIVIAPIYDVVSGFSEGIALVILQRFQIECSGSLKFINPVSPMKSGFRQNEFFSS